MRPIKGHKRRKNSKVTMKVHRKKQPHNKEDFQKIFRERFFV